MTKFVALAIMGMVAGGVAAVANAQATMWPVAENGQTCSVSQAFTHPDFGTTKLEIAYNAARQEVRIASTNTAPGSLRAAGLVYWTVVFLDNAGEKYDDQWGSRNFRYARAGEAYRFETAFAGEKNVRQIFDDLGHSRAIGLVDGKELVVGYDLDGARSAITRLNRCAEGLVASN